MRLEFSYTPDDLAEMAKAGSKDQGAQTRSRKRLFGWTLWIVLAAAIFIALQSRRPPRTAPTPPAPAPTSWAEYLVEWLPWVLVFLVVYFFVFRLLRARSPQSMW